MRPLAKESEPSARLGGFDLSILLREQNQVIGISTTTEKLEKLGNSDEKPRVANWFGGRLDGPNGSFVLVSVFLIGVILLASFVPAWRAMRVDPLVLMERNAEILLARSAAPDSISSDATILVLGRQGYETAVRGKNGFVCMVERSWMAAFDSPEFWNPKVRGANA